MRCLCVFAAGVCVFYVNLTLAAWIKFLPLAVASIIMTVVFAIGLAYFVVRAPPFLRCHDVPPGLAVAVQPGARPETLRVSARSDPGTASSAVELCVQVMHVHWLPNILGSGGAVHGPNRKVGIPAGSSWLPRNSASTACEGLHCGCQ